MGLDINSHKLYRIYQKNLQNKIDKLKSDTNKKNPKELNALKKKIKELENSQQHDCGIYYYFRICYNDNPLYNNVIHKYRKEIYKYLETHKCTDENGNETDRDYPIPVLTNEGVKKLLEFTTYEYQKLKESNSDTSWFEPFIEYLQWNADNQADLDFDC